MICFTEEALNKHKECTGFGILINIHYILYMHPKYVNNLSRKGRAAWLLTAFTGIWLSWKKEFSNDDYCLLLHFFYLASNI